MLFFNNYSDTYTDQFDGDYVYDQELLFSRSDTTAPNGIGLALDFNLHWKPSQKTNIHLKVKDLAGAIRWHDVPHTKTTANSETTTVDDTGFASVNPILSGRQGVHSHYTQHLKPSADLHLQHQLNNTNTTIDAKAKYINNINLFALGGSKKTNKGHLALYYWPQINTIEAGFQDKDLKFSVGIDSLDFSNTRTFWLSVKYQ